MTLREARWRDVFLLRQWRNHASTRAAMRSTEPIGMWEHLRWFWRVWRSKNTFQYVAIDDGRRVGSGRLDLIYLGDYNFPSNAPTIAAEIDVIIAPSCRNHGVGTVLIMALSRAAVKLGASRVYAVVKDDNRASLAAFGKVGFVGVPSGPVESDHGYQVLEYRRC